MKINLHFLYTAVGFNLGGDGIWEDFQQRAPILLEEALAVQTTYSEWLEAFMLEHQLSPTREADCTIARKKILEILAFGLTYEHANVSAVFAFLHHNESVMFPEGLEASPDMIQIHHMAEVFRENHSRQKSWPNDLLMASQRHPVSTREPNGALRDLKLYDRYLRPFWDEDLYEIRKKDDFELLTKLVELKLLDPRMTNDFLIQESGEKAAKLRLILTGDTHMNLEEASLRFQEMFRVACGGFVHSSVYRGDRQSFFQKQMAELRQCPEYFSLPFSMDLQLMASELKFEKQDDADIPNSGLFRELLVYCNERLPNFILHVGVAFFKFNPGRAFSKNFDISEIALAMSDKLSLLSKYREKNKAVNSIQEFLLVQFEIQKSFLALVPESVLTALNVDNASRLTLYHATGYPSLLDGLQGESLEQALSYDLGL